VGDAVDWHAGSNGYVASIRGWAADREALRHTRGQILDTLELGYD
jgi:hypothetical protein